MNRSAMRFVMSTELELLTTVPENPEATPMAIEELFGVLAELAPTLPGPSGLFNGYGRIYQDCGHVELAICECDSPYTLPLIVEQQQTLVARAVERLKKQRINLLLAANNHSGVLTRGCPVWGAHENYCVDRHPRTFSTDILPFLVTRIYGGAGGIEAPDGTFLAAVRPLCMELPTGGDTTSRRAIHSTSRDENHMDPDTGLFRYHLILGDGHRSHYNTSLQFGSTMLALCVCSDTQLQRELATLPEFRDPQWLALLNQCNVLRQPDGDLAIDSLVITTQRLYWQAASRFVETHDCPEWTHRTLTDWEQTLDAFERCDRTWLTRLDAFAKYEFYSAVLEQQGLDWADLSAQPTAYFSELALLDHSYHNFCDPDSVFSLLERDGVLLHRDAAATPPGQEREPFIPAVETRAKTRARFIKEHQGQLRYVVDWSVVKDREERRVAGLRSPFADEFGPWDSGQRESSRRNMTRDLEALLSGVQPE